MDQFFIIHQDASLPKEMEKLYNWVSGQLDSTPAENQDNKTILSHPLKKCYEELLKAHPALNGPDSTVDNELIDQALDYIMAKNVLMVSCGYSQLEPVLRQCLKIAPKYGLWVYRIEAHPLFTRHIIYNFPKVGKAILSSLKTPLFASAIIFAAYFILKLSWHSLPYYVPRIHIPLLVVIIITIVYSVFLFIIEMRNIRRRSIKWYDEPIPGITLPQNRVDIPQI